MIVAARITGYGEEYDTKVTCPSCSSVEEYSFTLDNIKVNDIEEAQETYGYTQSGVDTFTVQLPLTKASVECRLLTGADELKLYREAERKARRKISDSTLTDQFKAFIVSVNGNSDKFNLTNFINAMPARDSRFLRTSYGKIAPNVDLTQTFECSSCGYSADMEVPLTADFFWPR